MHWSVVTSPPCSSKNAPFDWSVRAYQDHFLWRYSKVGSFFVISFKKVSRLFGAQIISVHEDGKRVGPAVGRSLNEVLFIHVLKYCVFSHKEKILARKYCLSTPTEYLTNWKKWDASGCSWSKCDKMIRNLAYYHWRLSIDFERLN